MEKRKNGLPLKKKAFIVFSVVILLIGLLSIFAMLVMFQTYKHFNHVYMNINHLDSYMVKVEESDHNLNLYMETDDRSYISSFYQSYDELIEKMYPTALTFNHHRQYMNYENIKYMLDSYGEEAKEAINAYRKRDLEKVSIHMIQVDKIKGYIKEDINELVASYMNESRVVQKLLVTEIFFLMICVGVLAISCTGFYIFIALYFAKVFTKPIDLVVHMAKKIEQGQFEIEEVHFGLNQEMETLSRVLHKMSIQIKEHVETVEMKAEVERLLQTKKMENLKMTALLQEAELKRLQAQMNPHFLFNTLTTLHHTAFLEDANETCEITEVICKILRYNLRKSNSVVMLKEELENIQHYMYIQKKRYGNRIKVIFTIDEKALTIAIPNMTIQPIVENAFIHGLESCEQGGVLEIKIEDTAEMVLIEINDNGVGIEKGRLEKLRENIERQEVKHADTSSIGIKNVVQRLEHFYKGKARVKMESKQEEGTTIKIFLPKEMDNGGMGDD